MMSKTNQELKREKNRKKREKIDSTTNSYMVKLAWGIFVIIILRFIENGYSSSNMILKMPVIMKTFSAIFLLGSAALFVLGKKNFFNKKEKFYSYGIFLAVLFVGSLLIAFYPDVRNLFVKLSPSLSNIDSRWWISRGLIVLIALYLVAELLLTTIKIGLIEKGKI